MPQALIVEDDAPSLSALTELVQAYGFETQTAMTLGDARGHMRARMPDVILMDRRLPDGDGMCLLEDIPHGSGITVVLISGDTGLAMPPPQGSHRICRLEKPINIDRLKHILMETVRTSN